MNTIVCKHCGKEIEIDEALKHSVREQVVLEEEEKHKKEIEQAILDSREKAKKEIEEKQSQEFSELKQELSEQKKKNDEFREEQIKLREEKRHLEEEKKDYKLELEKQLDIRVKESIEKENDRHRIKELELEKKLLDIQKKNDEMRIQIEQGSQQTQGEVMELDFENLLIDTFPTDEIVAIGKGSRGADVRQIVKTQKGTVCGVILWETKQTKTWDNSWPNKLKADLRTEKANVPIIISAAFPKEIKGGMGFVDGVWVVNYALAITLSEIMRQKLIDVARQKFLAENKEGKGEVLYEYLIGHEFAQQIESIVEVYKEMNEQVIREKAAFEKQWKTRLEYSEKILKSTARMVGSIQGKIGTSANLQIKGLDMLELDSGPDE